MVIKKKLTLPGDKSISHRALILAAISERKTLIDGLLEADDVFATMEALQSMGVDIKKNHAHQYEVQGVGLNGLKKPGSILNLRNSGTGFRLLAGILSAQPFDSVLTGDASLQRRPMDRVIKPLTQMGAKVAMQEGLMTIQGNQTLRAINYKLPMPSAQVKSCLLLAGLYAEGQMGVFEPVKTRDHTERLLKFFNFCPSLEPKREPLRQEEVLRLKVPSDISSAAFIILAATLLPRTEIELSHVGVNPTRTGFIKVLKEMGASIELINPRYFNEEPVADIRVCSSTLKGVDVKPQDIPSLVDEYPILCIAAACAEGITSMNGLEELRFKECDRVQAMAHGLAETGICVRTFDDCMLIKGGKLSAGKIKSFSDHRVAMAFQVAGLVANSSIIVDDTRCISTSFPGFIEILKTIGQT